MPMTDNDSIVVIAWYHVVIAPSAMKNFNSQNARKWLDAIGVLSRDGGRQVFDISFQFPVFREMAKMIQLNTTNEFVMQLIATPLTAVVTHYASCLATSPKAMQYVADEMKLSPQQAASEQLGFADRSLGTLIPSKQVKTGRAIRDALLALGIYKANGRESLRGYVTVPIRDEQGTIIGIRGHKVDRNSQGEGVIEVGLMPKTKDQRQETLTNENTDDVLAARREPSGVSTICLSVKQPENNRQDDTPESSRSTVNDSNLRTHDSSLLFTSDDRQYRIRGLEKNTSTNTLRVNLMVSRDSLVHLDSLDLVKARSRASFVKAAASELFVDADIIKKDIGRLLLQLETLQAEQIAELKQPKTPAPVKLTAAEEREALSLLRDPNLLAHRQRPGRLRNRRRIHGKTGRLLGRDQP